KTIEFLGFEEIPYFFSDFGYGFSDSILNNFLKFKFDDKRVKKIVISEEVESKKDGKALFINLEDLSELLTSTNQEQKACNDTKKILIKNFLVKKFPEVGFDHTETNN